MNISASRALWFAIRTDKISKEGKAPIYLFYTLNNVRLKYSTDFKIFPEYWSKEEKRAIYIKQAEAKKLLPNLPINQLLTNPEIDLINESLAAISSRVKAIEDKFQIMAIPFSSKMVIEELKRSDQQKLSNTIKIEERSGLIFEFMDQYIKDHQDTREPGSLTVYKSVKNHLKAYQDSTGIKVTFESIDYNFFHQLQSFLINRKKVDKEGKQSPMLNNTTIAKALSTLKTFLGYARKQGIKVNDSYRDFTIKREKLEVIALDQKELDAIMNLDLSNNKRLEKARDIFCFSCTTGFRYSDVAQLKREHISDNMITLTVKKTKTELTVPLNSISGSILVKYKELLKPIPMVSNQGLNKSIKDLCKEAGIDTPIEIVRFHGKKRVVNTYPKYELVHFHTGRKTFVTLSLEKGMSAEEVMEISGHSDYKSFKRYVRVTEKRKKLVMVKAWGEVKNLKAV